MKYTKYYSSVIRPMCIGERCIRERKLFNHLRQNMIQKKKTDGCVPQVPGVATHSELTAPSGNV